MKTLLVAVIASAFSFGALAQTSPAMGASAPMAKPMASDNMKATKKPMKKHAAKKGMKKASAPAA